MHGELQTVLKWAWENRADILSDAPPVPAGSYSYATDPFANGGVLSINDYLGAMEFKPEEEEHGNPDDNAYISRYLDSLWVIATNVGCTELELTYISSNRASHKTLKVRSNGIQRLKRASYRGAYLGFRKGAGVPTGEIYVNIAQRGRIPALLELIDDVWAVDGFICAKVAGPWSDRIDTVIIEFSGNTAQQALLAVIGAFAARNTQHLRPRRRMLTMPVANMPGVSMGMGPPDVSVKRTNDGYEYGGRAQSYGIYRAQLIFMALERTERPTAQTVKSRWFNGKTYKKFKGRVETYFGKAGINTNKPWTQNPCISEVAEMQRVGVDLHRVEQNKKYIPHYHQQKADMERQKMLKSLPAHKKYKPAWSHTNKKGGAKSDDILDYLTRSGLA